jgi:hypothetical protein
MVTRVLIAIAAMLVLRVTAVAQQERCTISGAGVRECVQQNRDMRTTTWSDGSGDIKEIEIFLPSICTDAAYLFALIAATLVPRNVGY